MVEAHKQMAELKTKILLRNDTALNWSSVNPILGKGELGIEIDTGLLKIGDGVTTWSALSYFKGDLSDYYTKEQVDTLFENVDADKVFFGKDLIFTKEFGKYVPDETGSVTIPTSTNKMSLQDLLENAFAEELDPETTNPTLTLNSSNIGEKEVGTKIKVAYSYTSTAGSYTYGPETGVTWSNHKATFNGQTLSGTSGTFDEVQVTDATNLSISGSADHSEGAMPVTNLGNDYADGKIAAATGVSASKGTLKGYRKLFCGTMTTKETTLSSANIRGLSGKAEKAKSMTFTFSVPVGALRVICAVPKGFKVTVCKDKNGFDTDLIATGGMNKWTDNTVYVKGENEYAVTTDSGNNTTNGYLYNVWYQDFANANDTANTYTVTVAAE